MPDTGLVFDVQSLSTHDGPGIRTVVFFKGCPLSCRWCSNPEGIFPEPEIRWRANLCEGCGQCVAACARGHLRLEGRWLRIQPRRCADCVVRHCLAACPTHALGLCGETMSLARILQRIEQDRPYYRRRGGITLSGGEPLAQPAFAAALLRACRAEGIHTAVETSGHVAWSSFELVAPLVDLFLFDIKTVDPSVHRVWTGHDNQRILGNLKRLATRAADVVVRVPLIPGCNDTDSDAAGLGELLRKLGLDRVSLLPFHRLGAAKPEQLGLPPWPLTDHPCLSPERLASYGSVLRASGISCVEDGPA